MSRRLCAAVLALVGLVPCAQAQSDAVRDAIAGQGCAIGPQTTLSDPAFYDEMRAYAEEALARGQAAQQGEWIVLGPEICTIRVPDVSSAYDLTSPAVQRAIGDFVANEEFQEYGCFIDSEAMQRDLVAEAGLSEDEAVRAYLMVLAEGVRSGRATFYSDDILRTPMGFQSLIGACAEVPAIKAIRRSQALMVAHFGEIVRENALRVSCGENANPVGIEVAETLKRHAQGESVNEWVMLDVMMLAIAAGWIEGITATQRGTPRPPICSYGE